MYKGCVEVSIWILICGCWSMVNGYVEVSVWLLIVWRLVYGY